MLCNSIRLKRFDNCSRVYSAWNRSWGENRREKWIHKSENELIRSTNWSCCRRRCLICTCERANNTWNTVRSLDKVANHLHCCNNNDNGDTKCDTLMTAFPYTTNNVYIKHYWLAQKKLYFRSPLRRIFKFPWKKKKNFPICTGYLHTGLRRSL